MTTSATIPAWMHESPPALCPSWCTLPADHLDIEGTVGWSRMHAAFSVRVPISRGTRGDVRGAEVFVGQYESWDVGVGLRVQPAHLEVFNLEGDPVFGVQAVALAAALLEAGRALARITETR